MQFIEIEIRKPIFGTYISIRDIYVDRARRLNIPLKITIKGKKGEAIYTAEEFLAGAVRGEKVFLRPDEPMILYYRNINLDQEKEQKKYTKPTFEQLSFINIED